MKENKLRLFFVITQLTNSGAQNVFHSVIKELKSRGHDIYTISTVATSDANDLNEKIYGIKRKKAKGPLSQLAVSIDLHKMIKKVKPDAVIAFAFNTNIKCLIAGLGMRTPVIICDRMDPRSTPYKKLLRFERWLLYRFADGMIQQTEEIKNFYSSKLRSRAHVIHNPVRVQSDVCAVDSVRDKTIVTVARLDEKQKNLMYLLDAFHDFNAVCSGYKLLLLGDGPDREKLQKYAQEIGISEHVEFAGKVKNPSELVSKCELFVFTSYHEGMPNALIEAMSIGMPCIVQRFGGGAGEELIKDGENGIFLKDYNKEAFVAAMVRLAGDKELQKKLGRGAYKINQTHALPVIVDKWENAIESVIGKAKSKRGMI